VFTSIEVTAVVAFALEYPARLWSTVGHSLGAMTPARLEYALSSRGIIDLMAFLPSAIALSVGDRSALVLFGMLPFFKTAEARLADTAGAPKGDLAPTEIAQAERD
jgi:voltage-gated potassium channel